MTASNTKPVARKSGANPQAVKAAGLARPSLENEDPNTMLQTHENLLNGLHMAISCLKNRIAPHLRPLPPDSLNLERVQDGDEIFERFSDESDVAYRLRSLALSIGTATAKLGELTDHFENL